MNQNVPDGATSSWSPPVTSPPPPLVSPYSQTSCTTTTAPPHAPSPPVHRRPLGDAPPAQRRRGTPTSQCSTGRSPRESCRPAEAPPAQPRTAATPSPRRPSSPSAPASPSRHLATAARTPHRPQVPRHLMHVNCIHELCTIILVFHSYLHHIRGIYYYYLMIFGN